MDQTRRSLTVALLMPIVALPTRGEQTYPSRPVRVVVPTTAGGANTVIARLICDRLQASLGQPFLVENRGGHGGLLGVDAVAKAPADGLTLGLAYGGPLGSGLAMFKSRPYDALRDLAPIARVASVDLVMVSSASFGPKNVVEVIDYARAKPGMLKVGISVLGSMGHLLAEQFRLENGLDVNMIPYKGSSQVMPDLVGGQLDILFDTVPGLQGLIKGGRVHPYAVASPRRSEMLPDIPTFRELGFPRLEATTWYVMFGPKGTPAPIVERVSAEVGKILELQETKDAMANLGIRPFYAPPAATGEFMREETERWAKVVNAAGIRPE